LTRALLHDPDARVWLDFRQPADVLLARRPLEVMPVLAEAERRVESEGLWAAGFVSFAAAGGLDPSLVALSDPDVPLICLALFPEPEKVSRPCSPRPAPGVGWHASEAPGEYTEKIEEIKRQIALGNTYQINYTLQLETPESLDPWELFAGIAMDAPYGACLECGDLAIVSASPELFFRRDGRSITCRPMKGTVRRGMTLKTDLAFRDELLASAKCQAENIMIADMVRNDLGRIAAPGSVQTPGLLTAEKYATVWQMTSTVTADSDAPTWEVMRALFPCASVTGAPKVSSMAIIAGLERNARGVYTGAIGYLRPGRGAQFNVAIRTAVTNRVTGVTRYGIGGGIVWDSVAQEEYAECLLKSRILHEGSAGRDFRLIETTRWTPGEGYALLDEHVARMADSAAYFDFEFDPGKVRSELRERALTFPQAAQRVRMLLSASGALDVTSTPLDPQPAAPVRLKLAASPVRIDDPFLYHKTTRRHVYDDARASVGDCDEVLLWNSDGYLTEATIANIAVNIRGRFYTPPEECGLLAGTWRGKLLASGEIGQRRIRVDEVSPGATLLLFNSVRGVYKGVLVG